MKKILSLIMGAVAAAAAIFFGWLAWEFVQLTFGKVEAGPIYYSGKQIDLLSETAKALIPTITGFAVLAASGAGYLQQHAFDQFNKLKIGIYFIFVSVVGSLACWILLLGALIDCSRPFDREEGQLVAELTAVTTGYLQHTYGAAVILAKMGCVSFFFGIDLSLLVAVQALSERPRKKSD